MTKTKQSVEMSAVKSNRVTAKKRRSLKTELKRNKYLYILSIPVLLYFLIFKYLPMFGLVIAFEDFSLGKGIFGSTFVGFKYFKEFFSSVYFLRTLKNTLILSIMDIVIGFPIPIIFALLLNEVNNKYFKKAIQTASYLPHFISMVVICGMITDFFSTDGIFSVLISLFGGENMNYIGSSDHFRSIFVGTGIWQQFGWSSIIYIAALAGVDPTLYEAASVDGASKWKQTLHVTLPSIMDAWFEAMLYLRTKSKYPLQLILREILISNDMTSMGDAAGGVQDRYMIGETIKYATIMVATLPILCLYPFIQKYFVKGVMIGAVKG